MNITCKHCGRPHALFWLQDTSGVKQLQYTCDRYEAKRRSAMGYQELRITRKRLWYHGDVLAKDLVHVPTVLTKAAAKKEANAHQEKLRL